METTTNYGLKVYEGTDKFNPLTVENYNTEQIDEKMKANEDAGIGTATEIKGGIVHAITRANGDIPMFRFTATSNYESGDAFTVDGVNVTALTSTGETLDDGAYVIGAEVLCCLVGTRLTVFVGQTSISHASDSDKLGNQLPSYYAQTSWIGALAELITTAKNNLVSAINELATSVASLVANKQDKNDNSLLTSVKTIVGGINELFNNKQNKNDNALNTTSKTVVGAINEVNALVSPFDSLDITSVGLTFSFEKKNGVVEMAISGTTTQALGNGETIISNNVPEAYRPYKDVIYMPVILSSDIYCVLTNTGRLSIVCVGGSASGTAIRTTCTYLHA